jgi:membrane protease YdiL (CAAX protease family)
MRFLKSEAGAVIVWLIGTIVLAAILFPWIYQAGQAFGEYGASGNLKLKLLDSWAESARNADSEKFFSRSLYAAVLLLLPGLVVRLRKIRSQSQPGIQATTVNRLPWKTRLLHVFSAIVLAAGMLWLLGSALRMAGAFTADPDPAGFSRIISKAMLPAFFGAVIEEWLFRGLVLGIWLRILSPGKALFTVSFIFAFVHFLAPPDGSDVTEPAAPLAGFQMLGLIFGHFLNLQFIAAEFLVLFAVGLILGATRLRTGSLWFPVGLHAGWIFAFKSFNMLHVEQESPLRPLWIGESLRSGLLPLATLLVTAVICHFTLRGAKGGDDDGRNRATI